MNNRFHSEAKLPWSYDYPLANHIATNKSSANREMSLFSRLYPSFGYLWKIFPPRGLKYSLLTGKQAIIEQNGMNLVLIDSIGICMVYLYLVAFRSCGSFDALMSNMPCNSKTGHHRGNRLKFVGLGVALTLLFPQSFWVMQYSYLVPAIYVWIYQCFYCQQADHQSPWTCFVLFLLLV